MAKETAVGFGELLTQMRITNRLLAAGLKASMKQVELISLLASTGASNKEIADVLDTTPATVNVAVQRLKKKKAGKKGETASSNDTEESTSDA
jgi:DNA-binding CsgD family transcriptional regulator